MSDAFTKDALVLIDEPVLGNLATVGPDGYPHLTPVWVDHEGGDLLFNTAEGRVKARDVKREPHVAVSIVDPKDPYRVVAFRGAVTDITSDGADEHIDQLAKKYLGKDSYPFRRPGEVRIKVRVRPERIVAQPGGS